MPSTLFLQKQIKVALRTNWPLLIIAIFIGWFIFSLPKPLFQTPLSLVITDQNGQLLNAGIAADGQWRFPQRKHTPEKFAACVTTFEDKRFWYHPGVDPVALCRAMIQNIRNQSVVSGGSTITMQVIRLSRPAAKRTVYTKLTEIMLALRLECSASKDEVLSLYASYAPFGTNVVGIDAAAWRYFGQSPEQLSWGQMAALAVLPNAPSLVHPGKNRAELLRKRNIVLQSLMDRQIIDESTALIAMEEPLPGAPIALPQEAPHLFQYFRNQAVQKQSATDHILETTIDIQLQKRLSTITKQHQQNLRGNGIVNIAAMIMEVETGHVLAYSGNVYEPADSSLQSHVDVLQSNRSPGSTLKPLLYTAMLTDGILLPNQLIPDIPTQLNGYTPQNFDLGYDGAVPAHRALARSLNIPAIKMLQQYRYPRFYDMLKQVGFTTLHQPADHYGMSLILGGCEIKPFELCGVYASMARMYLHQQDDKGIWNQQRWFMPLFVKRDKKPVAAEQPPVALFSYTALWQTFSAMNEVMRPGEEGLWTLFQSAQKIAWKTGTSFGFRDGWAVGFNSKYAIVVWTGNTTGEGRPGLTGIETAAPVLFELFRLLPAAAWFKPPQYEAAYLEVCAETGFKVGPYCSNTVNSQVSHQALQRATICPWHKLIHMDATHSFRVTENCLSPADMQHVNWLVLPPTIEYYYRQKHPEYRQLPPFMADCMPEIFKSLDIIYPDEGARIFIPVELSGTSGETVFKATCRNSADKLFWHIDNNFVGATENFHQMAIHPAPGPHTVTVVNLEGNSVTRNFVVVGKE